MVVFNNRFQVDLTKDVGLFVTVKTEKQEWKWLVYAAQPQSLTPALQMHHAYGYMQVGATAAHKSSATPLKAKELLLEKLNSETRTQPFIPALQNEP